MTRLLSFAVTGAYASFRDPSITANQSVYYIPSKTSIIGILGAILGIKRDNTLDDRYSKNYIDFFSNILVGLKLENNPRKIMYFTNHRSLKKAITKPVKKEILESPRYRIYVKSTDDIIDRLKDTITNNTYVFSPYLGHAYCPAKIIDLKEHDAKKIDQASGKITDCVILDEAENYNTNFKIFVRPESNDGSLIIERHIHNFMEEDQMKGRVLKYWIPLESAKCVIKQLEENSLSEFYEINKQVCCLY